MIIEGTTEKVLQFSMLIMSIFNQNLGFTEKVCIFEHYREVQKIIVQLIDIDLVIKYFSDDLLRGALYRLNLVLNKDVLFHCLNSNIYSHLETSGGQSSSLYLNVVHFFNTGVN
jgi:hypothetical protein